MRGDLPPAPENVRLQMRDGTTIHVECYYGGIDADTGCAVWLITEEYPGRDVSAVLVDRLPSMCMIQLDLP